MKNFYFRTKEEDVLESIKNIKLKLIAIFLLPAIGMLYFSFGYVYEKISIYQNTHHLAKIVEYVEISSDLISELQRERGLSIAFLSKESLFFEKELKKQRIKSDEAFKRFTSLLDNYVELYNKKNIKNALNYSFDIGVHRKNMDKKSISVFDALDFYSNIITNLIESTDVLKTRFMNESFFDLIISFHNLLKLAETSGKERAIVSYILEKRRLTPKVSGILINLGLEHKELKRRFLKESSTQATMFYHSRVDKLLEQRYEEIKYKIIHENDIFVVDSAKWWELATDYIDSIYKANFLILQEIVELKKKLKGKALSALSMSVLLWTLSIFALIFLIKLITKISNTFSHLVQTIEDQKRLYKAQAEFSEVLVYNEDEKSILNSLGTILYKTEEFIYLWLGKVGQDDIEPIISEDIPIAFIQKELAHEDFKSSEFHKHIEYVVNKKQYVIVSCKDCINSRYDNADTIVVFPIIREDKVAFILVMAIKKDKILDAGVIDIIVKMTNELTYAFERITNRLNEECLKDELRVIAHVFDTYEAIIIADANGLIIKVNDAFTRITGYDPDEVVGKKQILQDIEREDRNFYMALWESIKKFGHWSGEVVNRRKSGEIYHELLSVSVIKNRIGEITHYIAHFFDISEMKKAQQDAEHRAWHDSLTGVYNRQKLIEELDNIYKSAKKEKEYNAFLFFDLDNFKYINDYYNHEVGDKVLIEVSKKIKEVLRENDIFARVAGDEFALIACNLGKDKDEAIKKVSILAERIKKLFDNPLDIDSYHIEATFSIGIKIFPDQEINYKDVMVNADIAMYYAKKSGKNQFHFFDEKLDLESKEFLLIKNELTDAIKNKKLVLHYQPKVSVVDAKIVGFEALIRWPHHQKGLLYPDEFLHATIGNRLSFDLSEYVLREVCLQINSWKELLPEFNKKISINISGEQFNNKNFTQNVMKIIKECEVNPKYLDFEIVEDALLKDIDRTVEIIKIFKNIGVTFSMDDFGTGYSSINYLKNLPVDFIKIDKDFILDLFEGKNSEIVKMIIDTAKIFDLKVVAEGVENKDILKLLDSYGCDYYQGYYFSKPISADEVVKMLEKENRN